MMSCFTRPTFTIFFLLSLCLANTVTFNWDIGWVNRCPDGFCRPVIGINGQWPLPVMEVDLYDTVVVNIQNSLGNETTTIHYHGEFMRGSTEMDGVPMVSQCPIPPGANFTQTFTAESPGTHWFHSHNKGQYPDGLRAPMIVHDRAHESQLGYDEEFVFSVSDWYHEQMPELLHEYLGDGSGFRGNSVNGMPKAPSSLLNDTTSITLNIESGKTYLVRMVSVAALFPHIVSFEDHDMTVVAVDSVPCNATTAQAITIAAGQRYDVLITGKSAPLKNYAITSFMPDAGITATGVLQYNSTLPGPDITPVSGLGSLTTPIDDTVLKPLDGETLFSPVDVSYTLPVRYGGKTGRRIRLGNDTYVSPKVPTLYTALTTGSNALDPEIYGAGANPYIITTGQVVQIIVENHDNIEHPMHLHGYDFQVVARGTGTWDGNESELPAVPMRRDTATTPPFGYLVLRIKTNNPGIWMFHCHMEFHMEAGMMVTLIESPDILQTTLTISQSQLQLCYDQNIPTSGNCAGKLGVDEFDTTSCNNSPPSDDWGALISPSS